MKMQEMHLMTRQQAGSITVAVVLTLVLSTLFGGSAIPAYAQAVDGTLLDIGAGEGRVLTSGYQTVGPGQQVTYQFAYDGDEQPISVTMNTAPADSAFFEIWTNERLEELSEDPETEPLGRGTPPTDDTGYTTWQGGSTEAETYFVVVSPNGDATSTYLLTISSPALAAEQPGAVATEATAPTTPVDPTIATVTTDALNVRSGPSTAFPVLTTVPSGTQMTVLARNPTNTWLNVQLEDGTTGWVTRSLTDYTLVAPTVVAPSISAIAGITATPTTTATTPLTATAGVTPTDALTTTDLGETWQILSDGETAWYTLQYRGGDLPLTIWMDLEPIDGAQFTVVSAETAEAMMADTPPDPLPVLGSGLSNPVQPGYLYWQSELPEADTIYIMVEPTGSADGTCSTTSLRLAPV